MKSPVEIHVGDVIEVLKTLPADSVNMVVTSPPYLGLRSYQIEPSVWGGKPDCEHEWGYEIIACGPAGKQGSNSAREGRRNVEEQIQRGRSRGEFCLKCGGWHGCLGGEPTVELFVEHIVQVFREVRRVMHPSATLWLNLGDCHANGTGGSHMPTTLAGPRVPSDWTNRAQPTRQGTAEGLKPKDLAMIPFRVALALQADGWFLRSVIPWIKASCLPESVTDRAHQRDRVYLPVGEIRTVLLRSGSGEDRVKREHTLERAWRKSEGHKAGLGQSPEYELLGRGQACRAHSRAA